MAGVQIQRKIDKPKIDRLLSFFENTGEITTGIHAVEGSADHDGPTVAQIAEQHEFGLGVPERSWLRAWFDENKTQIEAQISRQAQIAVKQGQSFEWAMERVALWTQASIQRRIRNQIPPPLAQATIDAKGSSVPLIDTGLLRASILSYFDGRKVEREKAPVKQKPEKLSKKIKRAKKSLKARKKSLRKLVKVQKKRISKIVKAVRKRKKSRKKARRKR